MVLVVQSCKSPSATTQKFRHLKQKFRQPRATWRVKNKYFNIEQAGNPSKYPLTFTSLARARRTFLRHLKIRNLYSHSKQDNKRRAMMAEQEKSCLDWERHEDEILDLFVTQNKTLDEVIAHMHETYNFKATYAFSTRLELGVEVR